MKTVLVLAVVVCAILVVADAKKRKCRYERKSKWSICTNGAQTKTVKLKVGSANCAPEKTRTRSCGAAPGLLKEKCKFEKGDWSKCNVTTNTQSRTMTLVNGKASCPPTKTKTRKCKQGCRYQKGSWTACSVAGRMTRVLTLVEGGDHCKPSKTRERKCKKAKMGYNGSVRSSHRSAKLRSSQEERALSPSLTLSPLSNSPLSEQLTPRELPPSNSSLSFHDSKSKSYRRKIKAKKLKRKISKTSRMPSKSKTTSSNKLRKRKNDKKLITTTAMSVKFSTRSQKTFPTRSQKAFPTRSQKRVIQKSTHVAPSTSVLVTTEMPKQTSTIDTKAPLISTTACIYRRVPWSQCDPTTNKMTRTMTLIPGSRHGCKLIKSVTRRCRHRSALTAARFKLSCKYVLQKTSNCNLRTNTVTKTLSLVKGDPHSCVPIKEFKRKCRKPCKFRKGSWSTCNMKTHLMIRKDILVKGDAKYCSKNREITKKCKKGKKKCQYGVGEWSDCDAVTNKRSRVKTLKKGDPSKCQAEKTITKACSRPNGKERCFFSQWGEYGKCMNGVMTKAREVIQGGTECERKAVKTKACS